MEIDFEQYFEVQLEQIENQWAVGPVPADFYIDPYDTGDDEDFWVVDPDDGDW